MRKIKNKTKKSKTKDTEVKVIKQFSNNEIRFFNEQINYNNYTKQGKRK